LLFQTLDDKKECVGIYDGDLIFNQELSKDLTHTWSYSGFLENREIEYAKLYCGGSTLDKVCPEALTERWERTSDKLKAFIKSFHTAGVSLDENCFFDLVPKKFLIEFCQVKNQICEHVFDNYERPKNYDYLLSLSGIIEDMKYRRLNINQKNLSMAKEDHRKFAKTLKQLEPSCKFNIYGTKTGRLTTEPRSFPVLTLKKDLRCVVEPHNDYFVELDFNAAELRTLISLQGKPQPEGDIHEWNIQNVFRGLVTRDEAKKRIFAWLYNPESEDYLCERTYDRGGVVKKYFTDGIVTTFFDKKIPSADRTALNYIIQSTCAENVLRQMIKVSNYLKGCKSYVVFPIHDSIVLDISAEEKEKLPEIIEIFSNTALGKFKVNISAGTNFGNLERLNT
tara:strand:- start:1120 stop:2301 length:1182 start_codon:yes stop_codon:yes gene_type:complete